VALSENKRQQISFDVGEVLEPGEELLDVTTCLAEVVRIGHKTARRATLALTDRRVIVFSKKLAGHDVQDFAYRQLTFVDHKRGIMFGGIELRAADDRVRLEQVERGDVKRIVATIRDRMSAPHAHRSSSAQPVASAADDIRKLAQLRDEGLISSEQFEEKTRQLLGL
jgi:PH (Pleckstrin Homology) domain-containing protein